jgi:hypothetical protein
MISYLPVPVHTPERINHTIARKDGNGKKTAADFPGTVTGVRFFHVPVFPDKSPVFGPGARRQGIPARNIQFCPEGPWIIFHICNRPVQLIPVLDNNWPSAVMSI